MKQNLTEPKEKNNIVVFHIFNFMLDHFRQVLVVQIGSGVRGEDEE